ncbi:MAG: ABC transporter ATP-binding protein [Alphaproteobacteria bacterium]|nr:ABC transporter ATP-binding protein [Alphaproteobacteria bacterium]
MYLSIHQLEVHYPNRPMPAVHDVNLALRAGEIGVLLGPSGCGKTTLLRAIAGLEQVRGGDIRLAGQTVSSARVHTPPEQRRIGMVFQEHALFPHLSVLDNVMFGLLDQPRSKRQARAAAMLELVGLVRSGQRFPHELSGGQQQRVALARALAPQPQLLLMDEPFSNLDIELRERLALEVRQILKDAQATALLVTHDQMEAFAMGDQIGVMAQGQLHQWDDAYTLYHRPSSRFVAEFIGHGVFVPAHIGQDGALVVVHTAVGDLTDVQECPLPNAYPNGDCDVLLRADDIVHDDDAPVKAEIIRKSFRGSEFLYTLRLDNGLSVMAHVPSHHDHKLGEWIGIRIQADHVVTFARA